MRKIGKQTALNIVWRHLRKQNEKCMVDDSCAYRGPGGTACAIGAMIPDDLYDPCIEGVGAKCFINPHLLNIESQLNRERKPFLAKINALFSPTVTAEFLDGLQRIHDRRPVECWESELRDFAKANALKVLA